MSARTVTLGERLMFKERCVVLPGAETFFLQAGLNAMNVTVRLAGIYIKSAARGYGDSAGISTRECKAQGR
jgi:hypothetical protein